MTNQVMEAVEVFHHQVDVIMKEFNDLAVQTLLMLVVAVIHYQHPTVLAIVRQGVVSGKPDLSTVPVVLGLLTLIQSVMEN